MQSALKMKQQLSCTQFEITTSLLRNLYKFDLTPVTKLVLLELTTHMNESKNGSVVFPSIGYIAEVLGIGLTAAKKAINDLVKQGFIIKSKRNVSGNHNKYLLTPKMQNMTSERSENELFKQSGNDLLYIGTNNKEQINNKGVKKPVKIYTNSKGGNVYSEEDSILRAYARKHGARNIDAYVNTLKKTKSAEKIIKEKRKIVKSAVATLLETQKQIQIYEDYKRTAESFETSAAWKELGKKFGFKK